MCQVATCTASCSRLRPIPMDDSSCCCNRHSTTLSRHVPNLMLSSGLIDVVTHFCMVASSMQLLSHAM